MATYIEIQQYVRRVHGFVPKTCWIAHVKELCGLAPRRAPNRARRGREVPCPLNKRAAIVAAFRHFRML